MSQTRQVSRVIRFYRVDIGSHDSGHPVPLDVQGVLRTIDTLKFDRTAASRYVAINGDEDLACWVERTSHPARVRFGRVKRSALPNVEEQGAISSLPISQGSGLLEQCHIVFFEDNVIGAEFNFYGPRMPRFEEYLRQKANLPDLKLNPILKHDISARLAAVGTLTFLRLKVRSSFAAHVAKANKSLGDALEAAAKVGGADEIEVVLKTRRRNKEGLSAGLVETVKKLVGMQTTYDEAQVFKVKGTASGTAEPESLDLLSDALIARKHVVLSTNRERSVDSVSAFQAIESAYEELLPQINAAPDIE